MLCCRHQSQWSGHYAKMDRWKLVARLGTDAMHAQNTTGINEHGFTIVELLVAMVVALFSLVVMAAIYSLFTTQQKSYIHQERVATIQQNLRSAMMLMERDIRLAGCNPTGTIQPKPGINTSASPEGGNTITMTMDITDTAGTGKPDGKLDGPNENVTYSLVGTNLMRNNNVVAEYIQSLTFNLENSSAF